MKTCPMVRRKYHLILWQTTVQILSWLSSSPITVVVGEKIYFLVRERNCFQFLQDKLLHRQEIREWGDGFYTLGMIWLDYFHVKCNFVWICMFGRINPMQTMLEDTQSFLASNFLLLILWNQSIASDFALLSVWGGLFPAEDAVHQAELVHF